MCFVCLCVCTPSHFADEHAHAYKVNVEMMYRVSTSPRTYQR